ncbi:hypothetical protein TUM22923_03440 [Polynucleobacter sp. TUM22923]|jgi:hypothetical protein|uniref:DUF6671 family protein n=1 Tax=Polynucleobacter sp. TUM22923 TaxID=3022126 RepID=UPI002573C272|nr:DUF6671 family protein [Polynucleobacter sp. TUM22923]BDX21023.1 hypothetical protein TUM22923_03440 [Polynucleobacter sp. TUM22923]
MNLFSNRTASLLTKHGKEVVIAPEMLALTGCQVQHTDAYDTDQLGTFTRETPRYGTQLDAARKKAVIGMDLLSSKLGLANEGAFVTDPYTGVIPWNNELVVLLDHQHQLEIIGFSSAPAQSNSGYLNHWEELIKFSESALFPSHHLVIKPTDEHHPQSRKGIKNLIELKEAFEWAQAHSTKGMVFVENDLRAFANPTRMENIRKATLDLIQKMNSVCPQCQTPGYWIKDIQRGLPCNACGLPTEQEIAKIWGCLKCDHQHIEGMKVLKFADPSRCSHCNP